MGHGKKVLDIVYFQPKGINKNYCEAGLILDSDKEYIYYLDEPCKIFISEVKIVDAKNVFYDKKRDSYKLKQQEQCG